MSAKNISPDRTEDTSLRYYVNQVNNLRSKNAILQDQLVKAQAEIRALKENVDNLKSRAFVPEHQGHELQHVQEADGKIRGAGVIEYIPLHSFTKEQAEQILAEGSISTEIVKQRARSFIGSRDA